MALSPALSSKGSVNLSTLGKSNTAGLSALYGSQKSNPVVQTKTTTPAPTIQQGTNPGLISKPYVDTVSKPADMNLVAQYQKQFAQESQPSTPVKSTTKTDAAGNTTKTEYHAPSVPDASFKGIVNSGVKASQNAYDTGSQNYAEASKGLLESLKNNEKIAKEAQRIASTAGQQIGEIGDAGARAQAGYRTTGTAPVGEGNAAVNAQTTAARQQAIAAGANTALQGTAQGLTAQGQTQSGFNQAGSLGLTAQGQGLSGLGTAAGYAAPQQYGLNTQPYNPLTDSYGGGGSGGAVNRGIQAANIASATELTNQKNQLQSTFNGVDANFQLLLNTAKQGGVNNTNVPALNLLQQNVSKGLASSEAVINFRNTLAAVRAGYAQILGGGTTTVDSQHRAEEAIPDNISLAALTSLGEQLKNEATNRITGIDQQIQSLQSTSSSNGGSKWSF